MYPDSLKQKIRLIQEIKQFTVDSLGLNPSGSYEKLFDQRGEPLIWMMLASKPYELKPYEWHFPVVGTFTYKGHFKKDLAVSELGELKKEGYDTRLGKVAAWSTLGYLDDPILSEMLNRDAGQLTALIIHELTHGTLYIKNDVAFNENLADFIGDYGAIRFLEMKFGAESQELKLYRKEISFSERYNEIMLNGSVSLKDLYKAASFKTSPLSVKNSLKDAKILEIMLSADTLGHNAGRGMEFWKNNLPNNAYFISFLNYQSKQNEFQTEFSTKFDSNYSNYISYLKEKYGKSGLWTYGIL